MFSCQISLMRATSVLVAVVSARALKSRPNGPLKPTMLPATYMRLPGVSPRLIRSRTLSSGCSGPHESKTVVRPVLERHLRRFLDQILVAAFVPDDELDRRSEHQMDVGVHQARDDELARRVDLAGARRECRPPPAGPAATMRAPSMTMTESRTGWRAGAVDERRRRRRPPSVGRPPRHAPATVMAQAAMREQSRRLIVPLRSTATCAIAGASAPASDGSARDRRSGAVLDDRRDPADVGRCPASGSASSTTRSASFPASIVPIRSRTVIGGGNVARRRDDRRHRRHPLLDHRPETRGSVPRRAR